jgi:hypothetical protein
VIIINDRHPSFDAIRTGGRNFWFSLPQIWFAVAGPATGLGSFVDELKASSESISVHE